jgi:hypothetical protein
LASIASRNIRGVGRRGHGFGVNKTSSILPCFIGELEQGERLT